MTEPSIAGTPLSVRSARVKEARKLSRRSVRAERRLFKFSILYLFALFAALVADRFILG